MIPRTQYIQSLAQLELKQEEMTQLLSRWVEINSYSRNLPGLNRMAEEIQRTFADLPAQGEVCKLRPAREFTSRGESVMCDSGHALIWRRRTEAPFRIILSGHFDTVYPPESDFREATIRDGRLHGPGSADMKGGLVILYYALRHFEEHCPDSTLGWDVVLVPDEEIGSLASHEVYARLAPEADVALIVEPSLPDGSLVRARSGSGSFNAVVTGRPAHVGRSFHEGRNAIAALAQFMFGFHALNGTVDKAIFNVGRVDGGGPLNVVPDRAAAQFNIRVAKPADIPVIEEKIASLIQETQQSTGCSIHWEGAFTRPPKPYVPAQESIYHQINKLKTELGEAPVAWRDSGGCSDGNNLHALGVPNLDTLGVRGDGIHSKEEYAILESLPKQAALLALLLFDWASGRVPAALQY